MADQSKKGQRPAQGIPGPGSRDEQETGPAPQPPIKAGYAVGQTSFDPPESGSGGGGGTKTGYAVGKPKSFDPPESGSGGGSTGKGGYAAGGTGKAKG